jgi:hypothetical protein
MNRQHLFILSFLLVVFLPACDNGSGATDAGEDMTSETDAGEDAGADAGSDPEADAGSDAGKDGTDTGPALEPDCTASDECKLHADCCWCLALAPGEEAPRCHIPDCTQDACFELGIAPDAKVMCQAGRCILGLDCDHSKVLCEMPQPRCQLGEVASVRGACWGDCVPASQCAFVPACTYCDLDRQVCVINSAFMTTKHCVSVPPACDSDRSCDCMGSNVCVDIFRHCSDGAEGEINCDCPNC